MQQRTASETVLQPGVADGFLPCRLLEVLIMTVVGSRLCIVSVLA